MTYLDDDNFTHFQETVENQTLLLIPILSDKSKHWSQNRISFIYIYCVGTFDEFIFSLNHNDAQNLHIQRLSGFLKNDVYVYRKKYLSDCGLTWLEPSRIFDAEMMYWFQTNSRFEQNLELPYTIKQYWNWYSDYENINDIIPIVKWLEYCREIKDRFIIEFHNFEVTEPFIQYNKNYDNLVKIERNGLYTN